jgi:hypothetical protein
VGIAIQDDVHVGGRASQQAVTHGASHEVGADAALREEGGCAADDM